MNFYNLVIALFVSSFLVSCNTTNSLNGAVIGKKFYVTEHSYDEIWNASLNSMGSTRSNQVIDLPKKIDVIYKNKGEGKILGNTTFSLFSYGEVVGVFINPPKNGSKEYEIEVKSEPKLEGNIAANDWKNEIIEAIKYNLKTKE